MNNFFIVYYPSRTQHAHSLLLGTLTLNKMEIQVDTPIYNDHDTRDTIVEYAGKINILCH